MSTETLVAALQDALGERILGLSTALGEVTIEISADCHHIVCERLRDDPRLGFEVMIDLCGIDYSTYGNAEWDAPRFAVVMQLLSIRHNHRVRLRSFCMDDDAPMVETVTDLWPCANWFERDALHLLGVQLGGAIKNVIAIGAGISDGMGFGANARTALITRGIAEISRLGTALGANPNTFMGMSGLGDLVLTCTDNQSRNRRFGIMLGQGFSAQTAMDNIGQVVEGFYNTKEAHLLAQRYGVEMPITEQIYQVLFCGKNAKEAAVNLLGRERKEE